MMSENNTQLNPKNIEKLELFLQKIKYDTYPEPPSSLHNKITQDMLAKCLTNYDLPSEAKILDIGCGQGVALELFIKNGFKPIGITLNSEDVRVCRDKGYEVYEMDQSFLDFDDRTFDFIWCRHCIEHSIFPYFTLSEIYRVLKFDGYVYIEVPAPDTSCRHQDNPNHYSTLGKNLWLSLIKRTGFTILDVLELNFTVPAGPDTYWSIISQKIEEKKLDLESDIQTRKKDDRRSHEDIGSVITLSLPFNNIQHNLKLLLNPNEMTQKMMLDFFKSGKLYEPEISGLLLKLLQKGDCFIDIGAHIGYYSMLASILVGESGFIYAVEPALSNQEYIQENIKLNDFQNIKLIPFALGAETKDTELFINLDNDGGHALFDVGNHPYNKQSREHQTKQKIHLTTLDKVLKSEKITNLKMIKIDVEGAEYQAFQGAVNTLNTYKVPYIICEINRFALEKMGTSETQLRDFMKSLGYETYLLLPNAPEKSPIKLPAGQYFQSDYVFNVLFSNQASV